LIISKAQRGMGQGRLGARVGLFNPSGAFHWCLFNPRLLFYRAVTVFFLFSPKLKLYHQYDQHPHTMSTYPEDDIPTSAVARRKLDACKKRLGMLSKNFVPYSDAHPHLATFNGYTRREVESADMAAQKILKSGGGLAEISADIAKSGYRVPSTKGIVPTTTTTSKIHHFGLHKYVDGYTLLAL
jgi:hypothetical protein